MSHDASGSGRMLQLKRQPVRNDLRAGVPVDRFERAVDRGKRPRNALSIEGPRQAHAAARRGRHSPDTAPRFREPPRQARRGRAPSKRAPEGAAAPHRDRRRPARTLALSSRRRAIGRRRDRAATPRIAASRASRKPSDPLLERLAKASIRRGRRRLRVRRRVTVRLASARRRCRRESVSRTAAAGSASAPSAAARRDATSPSTNIEAEGGSSSVLSSAFCASVSIASASSTITTRRRPSNGR